MVVLELGVLQVVGWYLGLSMVAAAGWVTLSGQHRNPQHDRELAWFLWHWFTGGPLETTRAYPRKGGRPRRTATRTAIGVGRTLGLVGFVASIYLQSGASGSLTPAAAWSAGGAAALALGTLGVTYAAMEWSMWRHYTQPLYWAVAGPAGWPLDLRWWQVRKIVAVRRTVDGMEVFVTCGPTFQPRGDTEKKVIEIVVAKLGLSNVKASWKREGRHRYVEFIRQAPVPAKVPFRDSEVRRLIEEESTSSRVLLGFRRGGEPMWLDLDKAPHVLISAGTGGGKSAALAGVTSQLMWHGAQVIVLDVKRMSHLWLRDFPDVRYARAIEEIHQSLLDVQAEIKRRTALWDPVSAEQLWAGDVPRFPRMVVLFDEISSTMGKLRSYWTRIREPGDPPRSPALEAWDDILNMGRQMHVNVLAAGQRGSARAVGDGDNRENFEMVCLVDRYSPRTWKMFSDEPFVSGISHAGRAQVLIGADVVEVQMLWIEQRDAFEWVRDKKGLQPNVHHEPDVPVAGETGVDTSTSGRSELAGGVLAMSLWAASADKGRGVVSLKFGALCKAAQRDRRKGEFPEPVNDEGEYDPRDLQRWERNRPRTSVVDGVDDLGGNEGDEVDRVDGMTNDSLAERVPEDTGLQPKWSTVDSDRERFWSYVAAATDSGCRMWTGAVNGDGRPYIKVAGKSIPAHQLAYELQVGPIPPGMTVDHLVGPGEPCTGFLCMEGDHLQLLNRSDHSRLEAERRRARQGATT